MKISVPLLAAVACLTPAAATDTNEKISFQLRALGTYLRNGVHEATTMRASGGGEAAINGTGTAFFSAGFYDEQGRATSDIDTRTVGGGEARKDDFLEEAPHLWWVEFQPLPAELGRVEFLMTWEHFYAERRGEPKKVGGDTRRVSMREGESHVFDYIAVGSTDRADGVVNRVLEVTASVVEDPLLAQEHLDYSLWYRHTDDSGQTTTRRFQTSGRQGQTAEAQFAPLRFQVPGTGRAGVPAVESILEVSASIQGRARRDGSVDVRLDVSRWIGGELAGSPRTGGTGDGGLKVVNMAVGETVSLMLPVPGGGRTVDVTVEGGGAVGPRRIVVENRKFYAQHKDELILTVTRDR